jgi:bacterioferritin
MKQDEAIAGLNELFAEEVEAAIRYLHLMVTIKGLDRILLADTMKEGMRETLEHAQTIAERIVQMGGTPSLEMKLQLPPEKVDAREAIENSLAFEQAALDAYREFLEKLDGSDIALEEFIRGQVAIETEHVAGLSLLLET